jgi:hypothetical protein
MIEYLFTLFSPFSVAFSPNGYRIDEQGIDLDTVNPGGNPKRYHRATTESSKI